MAWSVESCALGVKLESCAWSVERGAWRRARAACRVEVKACMFRGQVKVRGVECGVVRVGREVGVVRVERGAWSVETCACSVSRGGEGVHVQSLESEGKVQTSAPPSVPPHLQWASRRCVWTC